MTETAQGPLVVNSSPAKEQVASATRILLAAGFSYAVGRHFISGDLVAPLTVLVTVGGPLAWGWVERRLAKRQLVVAALAHPDVVVVK